MDESDYVACRSCGRRIHGLASRCRHCHAAVDVSARTRTADAVPLVAPTPQPEPPAKHWTMAANESIDGLLGKLIAGTVKAGVVLGVVLLVLVAARAGAIPGAGTARATPLAPLAPRPVIVDTDGSDGTLGLFNYAVFVRCTVFNAGSAGEVRVVADTEYGTKEALVVLEPGEKQTVTLTFSEATLLGAGLTFDAACAAY